MGASPKLKNKKNYLIIMLAILLI